MDTDLRVRLATFDWLSEQTDIHGDVLPRELLQQGIEFEGNRVPLISPQGIFKPRILDLPLTITTSPKSPYDDSFGSDGFVLYRYRGSDPNHRDNVALRKVFELGKPLVYFHGIMPSRYLAVWPVFVIGDSPSELTFEVAVEDLAALNLESETVQSVAEGSDARRAYLTTTVKMRLHQRGFRERVLEAYRSQCAFCRLRQRELLDAAHIIPDRIAESSLSVTNGMALCKLHHAAYDSFILGVSPDFIIEVRLDVLEEVDGPILVHGLQSLHSTKLFLPTNEEDWPAVESLEWRYERFLKVA